jgi:hypothetical protein
MEVKYFIISDLEAGKRQLESAVKLFFHDADVVSIHTLACAAHEVLNKIGRQRGVKSILKDLAKEHIKKEKWKYYVSMTDEAKNFFKHANKNQIKFNPTSTSIILFDAFNMYFQITHENVSLFSLMNIWFYLNNPEMVTNIETKNVIMQIKGTIDPINKIELYNQLPFLEKKFLGL